MASKYYAINNELIFYDSFKTKVGPAQPKFTKGVELILFEKDSKQIFFTGTSEVIEVKTVKKEEAFFQIVKIDEPKLFEKELDLAVFAGSLKKVYRYLEPYKHFQRRIVALDQDDFETIVNKKLCMSRTIFRYLFSSLPLEIQTEFFNEYHKEMHCDPNGIIKDYSLALRYLIEYFKERIVSLFGLFAQFNDIYDKFQENNNEVPELSKLSLASGDMDEQIWFGRAVKEAKRLFKSNAILSEGEAEKSLLEKTNPYLDEERNRKWKDPIF